MNGKEYFGDKITLALRVLFT